MKRYFLLLLFTFLSFTGFSATFIVNSTGDQDEATLGGTPGDGICGFGGTCTLRAAIDESNALPSNDVIILAAGTTYPINFTLSAANAGTLTIQGNGSFIEKITGGLLAFNVVTGATFFVNDLTVRINGATGGGTMIDATPGSIILNRCTLENNIGGNGIDATAITMNETTVRNNAGIGVFITDGTLIDIQNSTISGNSSAGLSMTGTTAPATITFRNNTVSGNLGAGLLSLVTITNTFPIVNCTIAGNNANGISGNAPAFVSYQNSVIVNNIGGNIGPNCTDLGGNQTAPTVAWLGALSDNGGSTSTHALLAGSPAINTGNIGIPPTTDQRGTTRTTADAGAFEFGATLTTLTVTTEADAGVGSLRKAITDANLFTGTQTINFNIQGGATAVKTITPLSALPDITQQLTIDGYTQTGASANTLSVGNNAVLTIELNGASAGGVNGLTLTTGSNGSIIKGLVINGFSTSSGVSINVANTTISGCYIGTDASGTVAIPNNTGIAVFSPNNTIGGTTVDARNLISGNPNANIGVFTGATGGNLIQGNLIGTNASVTAAITGASVGISLNGSSGTTVGGTVASARNIISGHGSGILIFTSNNNTVQGNYIGTNASGTGAIANTFGGIRVENGSTNNLIGGTVAGARNVISGNGVAGGNGISISGAGTSNNQIKGNYIGTDVNGNVAIPNGAVMLGGYGVILNNNASGNLIGGTAAGEGNLISGNASIGLAIDLSTNNTIQGNLIGTNANGTAALGNGTEGIYLQNNANNNLIGGATAGARNVISGNLNGITMAGVTGNTIQGNYIGTNISGTGSLANTSIGVLFEINTSGNTIGGTNTGEGNIIAFNGYVSILMKSGSINNRILRNSIFSNATAGIDLNDNAFMTNPDPNDPDDPDTGANNLQNFPEFSGFATLSGATVSMTYKVPSVSPNSAYPIRVEFFRADAASRQGRTFLGFDSYTLAEANKSKTLPSFSPAVMLTNGDRIVATATDANGNTSEFSAEVAVSNTNGGLHPDDYAALIALYNATNGTNWTNTTNNIETWFSDPDAENWFGITTDGTPPSATRRVREIKLGSNNLVGTLPTEIGNLVDVKIFWVMFNSISGTIPSTVGNLVNLTDIRLHDNPISGGIPANIGNLVNLKLLGFGDMELSGEIPATLANLINIEEIFIQGNNLTGQISPTTFNATNFPLLIKLRAENNQFSGTIPNVLGNISSLDDIRLSNNLFTDMEDFSSKISFTPSIFEVANNKLEFDDIRPNLSKLGLPKNYAPQAKIGIPQTIPVANGASQILTISTPEPAGTTNTYQWKFNGVAIGSTVGGASSSFTIAPFDLSKEGIYTCVVSNDIVLDINLISEDFNVQLSGSNVDSLALVAIYNATNGANWINNTNWLTSAPINNWHGVTVSGGRVRVLDLPTNNLVGVLPPELGDLTELNYIFLKENQISSIPSEIGSLTNLLFLELANNTISSIPAEIGLLGNLQTLYLARNQIANVPKELWNLTNLQILALDENQISGNIPTEVNKLTNIQELYLHFNQFSGEVPNLNTLFVLRRLYLNNNQITAISPNNLPFTSNLEHLNLSNNQIYQDGGELLNFIGSFYGSSLKLLNLSNNQFFGTLPLSMQALSNADNLDLSGNDFTDIEVDEFPPSPMFSLVGKLNVQNNRLEFNDIVDGFYNKYLSPSRSDLYAPQKPYRVSPNRYFTALGSAVVLDAPTPNAGNTSNEYQWKKGNTNLGSPTVNSVYTGISSFAVLDTGLYNTSVSNDDVPGLILESESIQLLVLTNTNVGFVVNTKDDTPDINIGDGVCADANGNCSFRAAIQEANQSNIRTTITFAIPTTTVNPVAIITLSAFLPDISQKVTIDGSTQYDAVDDRPLIVLDGINLGTPPLGLHILSDSCVIYGLQMQNFDNDGGDAIIIEGDDFEIGAEGKRNVIRSSALAIKVFGGSNGIIQHNIIDSNSNGIFLEGDTDSGIYPIDNQILDNIITNNGAGISISSVNSANLSIKNNLIGIDENNTVQPNQNGITIGLSSDITIGGTLAEGNVISGNGNAGISLGDCSNIIITGNKIGTNIAGNAARGNEVHGISLFLASNITIGESGKPNIISGNGSSAGGTGINMVDGSNNLIAYNLIGLNANGSIAIPNAKGVYVSSTNNVQIRNNTISGNGLIGAMEKYGIYLNVFSGTNIVSQNKIGTNTAGTGDIGNRGAGILLDGTANLQVIDNLIAGNDEQGVLIQFGSNNTFLRNQIGKQGIPNTIGIRIENSTNNIIGDNTNANINTISYNSQIGIGIDFLGTDNNNISRNSIFCNGTGADKGINITNGANNGIATFSFTADVTNYDCSLNTVSLTGFYSPPIQGQSFDIYRIDDNCTVSNQGKTYIGSFTPSVFNTMPFYTWDATLPLSIFQFNATNKGRGIFVLLSKDPLGNTSHFSDTVIIFNKPTIVSIVDESYPTCDNFVQKITINLSKDSPDGSYYIDFGNIAYADRPNVSAVNHQIVLTGLLPPALPPFDFGGIAAYFNPNRFWGCIPNPFPTTIIPYTAPPIPPPVVVDAIATDATVCDKPNGTLVLTMDNVQEGQSYFIDIDGDGQADLNATAQNSQLIVNNIVGGTIITSIAVTQPALSCESNVFDFDYFYPELPLPNNELFVYPELDGIESGEKTNVIVEGAEEGVTYQLQRSEDLALVGNALEADQEGIVTLPTEALTETLTYQVIAKNKITGCSTVLENRATVVVDNKCITDQDLVVLGDIYRGLNGQGWRNAWDLEDELCDYFGVEINGDRVTGLSLANNNLFGNIPNSILTLNRLRRVDFSNNFFTFDNLEPFASRIPNFTYAPQNEIYFAENVKANQGTTVRMVSLTGGSKNRYQWYKNDVALENEGNISGADEATLVIRNVTIADEGEYYCLVDNELVPALTLKRSDITLSIVPELREIDIEALIKLYNALGGTEKWTCKWDRNQPISTWCGLVFQNGNLVQISLPNNGLEGEIPDVFDAEIFEDLIYLNLSNNQIYGNLPESLRLLTKLAYLDLSQNQFEGDVPAWIGDFPDLVTLLLSYNFFTSLPPEIGNLSKLRNLFLNSNFFEEIPEDIEDLVNLEVLNLEDNLLLELPEAIVFFAKLKYLNISNNFLEKLPDGIGRLEDLEEFYAYANYIDELPEELTDLVNLRSFALDFNNLDFGDLEDLVDFYKKEMPNLDFLYAPQAPIGEPQELNVPLGSPFELKVITGGKENEYQWFKNGSPLANAKGTSFSKTNAEREDTGIYVLVITNKKAPQLTLRSAQFIVRTDCQQTSSPLEIEVRGQTIYCNEERINTILVAPMLSEVQSYQWLLNNVKIANATLDRITVREEGNYAVLLITKENCVSTSKSVSIRKFVVPQVTVKATQDVLTAETTAQSVSNYEWFLNNNVIPNATNKEITVTESGIYYVRITDENGCRSFSAQYNHRLVGVEEDLTNQAIKVYPNPTQNKLTIEAGKERIKEIRLYEISGKYVKTDIENLQHGKKCILDLTSLAIGVYMVEIHTHQGTIWRKVVKE